MYREPQVEKIEPNMHDIDDEEEDTLSFCEFSIDSDVDAWENSSSKESQNSSSSFKSSETDDLFEFFSEELSTRTAAMIPYPPENIIFCGKLISHQEPSSENTKKVENIKQRKHKKIRGAFTVKWNFASTNSASESTGGKRKGDKHEKKSSQNVPGSHKSSIARETSKEKYNTRIKRSKEQSSSVHKVPVLSSIGKSRWYFFVFGITQFRTNIELRDMKDRQSRRQNSSFSLFRLEGDDNNNENACMSSSKRFCTLLRALSCGGDHHDVAIMKPSTGGAAQV